MSEDNSKNIDTPNDVQEAAIQRLEQKLKKLDSLLDKNSKKELSIKDLDDENSLYIREQTLVQKYLKLWTRYQYLCQRSDGRAKIYKKLSVTKSKHATVNETVKNYLIKKRKVPDCPEICKIISDHNKCENLGLSKAEIIVDSYDIFNEVCGQLQVDRKKNFLRSQSALFNDDLSVFNEDPADKDPNLQKTLELLAKKSKEEFDGIIRDYSIQQFEMTADSAKASDEIETKSTESEKEDDNDKEPDQQPNNLSPDPV